MSDCYLDEYTHPPFDDIEGGDALDDIARLPSAHNPGPSITPMPLVRGRGGTRRGRGRARPPVTMATPIQPGHRHALPIVPAVPIHYANATPICEYNSHDLLCLDAMGDDQVLCLNLDAISSLPPPPSKLTGSESRPDYKLWLEAATKDMLAVCSDTP